MNLGPMDFMWVMVLATVAVLFLGFYGKAKDIEAEKKRESVPGSLRGRPPAQPPVMNTASPPSTSNPTLLVVGWTLLGAAVLMHISIIEWDATFWSGSSHIALFFHARDQFKLDEHGRTYNIAGASFWGLVIPFLLAGAAIAVITRAKAVGAAGPSPPVTPQASPKPSPPAATTKPPQAAASSPPAAPSRLRPCPDCNRSVSRRAPACPGCGCPLEPDAVCPDCQEFVARGAAQCPNCGCPLRQESKVEAETPLAGSPSTDTYAPAGFVIDDDDNAESVVDLPAVDEGPPTERPESGGG